MDTFFTEADYREYLYLMAELSMIALMEPVGDRP
jgi:hypothetical protein